MQRSASTGAYRSRLPRPPGLRAPNGGTHLYTALGGSPYRARRLADLAARVDESTWRYGSSGVPKSTTGGSKPRATSQSRSAGPVPCRQGFSFSSGTSL